MPVFKASSYCFIQGNLLYFEKIKEQFLFTSQSNLENANNPVLDNNITKFWASSIIHNTDSVGFLKENNQRKNYEDLKKFDEGDEPLSGIKLWPGGNNVQTDEEGLMYITGLSHSKESSVTVDGKSLEDPYWKFNQEGFNVVSRPGAPAVLDFPVVLTDEIDGMVYLQGEDASKAVSNVQLQLVNSEGLVIQEVKTAYDGFYLFTLVPPGKYYLRIAPSQLKRLKLKPIPKKLIVMESKDNIISNFDITLEKLP